MKHDIQFNSDQYQPVQWTNIIGVSVREATKSTKRIYNYTLDHLSRRKSDNQIIAEIETVKSQFIDIIALFEQIDFQLLTELDLTQSHFIVSKLIQALELLARLAGARAVLKNNAVEFIFYLKLFQKFIFSVERVNQ